MNAKTSDKPHLQLHVTSGGTFRVLVNGHVYPLLVGFETVDGALEKTRQLFPDVEVQTISHIETQQEQLFAVCLKESLTAPVRRYMGTTHHEQVGDLTTAYVGFTRPEDAVHLVFAAKFRSEEDASHAIGIADDDNVWVVVPIKAKYTYTHD